MILVAGATGTLGGRIVRSLLEQGETVRILVREPSPSDELAMVGLATSAGSLIAAGAEAVVGDLTDRDSLDAACFGVDTVITTASASKRDGDLEAVDLNGTLNLIDAAVEADVGHFIYTGAFGRRHNHHNQLFHIKAVCEKALRDSGLTFTVLLPGVFAEVWVGLVIGLPLQVGRPVTLIGRGDHKHAFASERDVAAFAVAAVDNPLLYNSALEIGGPAYTWTEIVDMAGDVLGRRLPVSYAPPGSDVPLLDPVVSDLLNTMETYEDTIDMGDMPARLGVQLTPLPAVLQHMFDRVPA